MDNDDIQEKFQGGDPIPFEPEADPYALNDDAEVDPEQAAFINQKTLYDLNTQHDPDNYPEL